MRGVKVTGAKAVTVSDWDDPVAADDAAVVRIHAASICGSDLHSIYRRDRAHPVIPGHEGAGVVLSAVRGITEGTRVMTAAFVGCGTCQYCREGYYSLCTSNRGVLGFSRNGVHAEQTLVPSIALLPLPDTVSFEAAACILDPVGTSFHALRRMGTHAGHTVAVFGLGPMGLGAVLVASFFGAEVIAIDPIPYRRSFAAELGARHVLAPDADVKGLILNITQGRGLDMALQCSSNAEALKQALDAVRPRGHVSIIGESPSATIDPSAHFVRKEITLSGNTCFPVSDYEPLLNAIAHGLDPARLITHRFPLADAAEAYAAFDRGETGKVVLLPQDRG